MHRHCATLGDVRRLSSQATAVSGEMGLRPATAGADLGTTGGRGFEYRHPDQVRGPIGQWPRFHRQDTEQPDRTGRPGRQSKSFTVAQARALITAAKETRWHAYIVLCMMTGIRTQEARALTWDHVSLDEPSVAADHSVRSYGDVKTPKSRRKLVISQAAADAWSTSGSSRRRTSSSFSFGFGPGLTVVLLYVMTRLCLATWGTTSGVSSSRF
jgi:integrase